MIASSLNCVKDLLTAEFPDYQITLNSRFGGKKEQESLSDSILISLFSFTNDISLKNKPSYAGQNTTYLRNSALKVEIIIFVKSKSYEKSLNAIEKIHRITDEKRQLKTSDFEGVIHQKSLTYEQGIQLFNLCGGEITPYLFLEIKLQEKVDFKEGDIRPVPNI